MPLDARSGRGTPGDRGRPLTRSLLVVGWVLLALEAAMLVAMGLGRGMRSAAYVRVAEALHSRYAGFVARNGFWDAFLVSPEGDVVFTVARESDAGENLITGPLGGSELARAVRVARETLDSSFCLGDHYGPSGKAAAFFAAPVIDGGGRLAGIFAAQVDLDAFVGVAAETVGLGRTAQTFIARIGRDGAIVQLIGDTRTETGLQVRAELDDNCYPTGTKVPDEELAAVRLRRAKFHGEWNYTVCPASRQA